MMQNEKLEPERPEKKLSNGNYTIIGKKVKLNIIKCNLSFPEKDYEKLYEEITNNIKNKIKDGSVSIELLETYLNELESINGNENIRSKNRNIIVDLINMLKTSAINSEFELKVYLGRYYRNTYSERKKSNVRKENIDIDFSSLHMEPIRLEIGERPESPAPSIQERKPPEPVNEPLIQPSKEKPEGIKEEQIDNIPAETRDEAISQQQIESQQETNEPILAKSEDNQTAQADIASSQSEAEDEENKLQLPIQDQPKPKEPDADKVGLKEDDRSTAIGELISERKDEQEKPVTETSQETDAQIQKMKSEIEEKDKVIDKLKNERDELKNKLREVENQKESVKSSNQKHKEFIIDCINKIVAINDQSLENEIQKLNGLKEKLNEIKLESSNKDAIYKYEEECFSYLCECLKTLKTDKDNINEEKSKLNGEKQNLNEKNEKQRKMLQLFYGLYNDNENINISIEELKSKLEASINEVHHDQLENILKEIDGNSNNFYALKKLSNLERLKKALEELEKNEYPSEFTEAMIKGIEKGISENQIDWEVTAQFLVSKANDYLKDNKGDNKELDNFLDSLGFKQICPYEGSGFNTREHDVNKVVAGSGLSRGQIVSTIKRGLRRGDRVIQKALVNIAQ